MLSLEEAHWRLSALPASLRRLPRPRHAAARARPADIVVYDFERLGVLPSEVAHDLPGGEWRRIQRAEGYRWILVNGEVTIEQRPADQHTFRPPAAPWRIRSPSF